MPMARRFSLPLIRYFQRHSLPPAGETSRYRPPPSNRRCGLSADLALRIAVSVSMGASSIGGIASRRMPHAPQNAPTKGRIAMDAPGRYRTRKRPEPLLLLGFPAFFGCRWTACWWRWRESNPRPKALDARIYMLSSPFDLVPRQVRWAKRTAEPA